MIKFVDMFSGIGGFREGLTRAGGFTCVGHCEIDKYANRSYNALFDTKGEWFIEDARKADPSTMPDFQLLCGGFPCQTFSIAGTRKGFGDPRGTLFFELARLAEARKPPYLLFENVPGLLSHDGGRTFATILNTLDRLGYGVEWQCLNSKDFGVPQSRNRVYIVGYLDERCRGKVFPFTETTGGSLMQTHGRHQGERVYSPEGLSCTLAANPGGFGGKTGLYEVGVPIKCATKTGYQMAQVGDSIDLSYATVNSRRGRVGKEIAHTLTTGCQQGTVEVRPVKNPIKSDLARNTERTGKPGAPMHTLTTKDRHGVLYEGRIRRLTPRECLRLQGWADDRIPYTGKELTGYRDVIRDAIYEDVKDFYGDLMRYYREDDSVRRKVVRAIPTVDEVNGELVGSLWVDTDAPLTAEEQAVFCAYISGQYSDGWGEGFEQREIDVGDGKLYVHFWQDHDFELKRDVPDMTEFKKLMNRPKKPKMQLIGQDGNIFAIMGRASRLLKSSGQGDKAKEMRDRVMSCDSYQKALSIVSEYVETELSPSPTPKRDRGDAR